MSNHTTEYAKEHAIVKLWLDIHDDMKPRAEYYWGWYCGYCNTILGEKGKR